jgi:hypothetical protein
MLPLHFEPTRRNAKLRGAQHQKSVDIVLKARSRGESVVCDDRQRKQAELQVACAQPNIKTVASEARGPLCIEFAQFRERHRKGEGEPGQGPPDRQQHHRSGVRAVLIVPAKALVRSISSLLNAVTISARPLRHEGGWYSVPSRQAAPTEPSTQPALLCVQPIVCQSHNLSLPQAHASTCKHMQAPLAC